MLGLGIMGTAMSANLLAAGFKVFGFDVSAERLAAFTAQGGTACASAREVAEAVEVMVSVLPSVAALDAVVWSDSQKLQPRSNQHVLPWFTICCQPFTTIDYA